MLEDGALPPCRGARGESDSISFPTMSMVSIPGWDHVMFFISSLVQRLGDVATCVCRSLVGVPNVWATY